MKPAKLVTVVIINFNSGKFIERCLDCVDQQTYPEIEIIVIDNASTDNSKSLVKNRDARILVQYIDSSENLGSSKANNLGIKKGKGEYFLILNADVFLERDYIKQAVMALENNSAKVGTVVGKLLSAKDRSIIDSAGIEIFKEGVAHERGMGEKDLGQYDEETYLAGACCAAAIYTKEMLEAVKIGEEYYDESFFAFVEDLDISIMGLLLGFKTLYCPSAIGLHVRGGATSKMSNFVQYLNFRNTNYFLYKTYSKPSFSNFVLRKILFLFRRLTVSEESRKQFQTDFLKHKKILDIKRSEIAKKADFSQLKNFGKRSYLLVNLKNRILR